MLASYTVAIVMIQVKFESPPPEAEPGLAHVPQVQTVWASNAQRVVRAKCSSTANKPD
jgi:hypothetical protein